MRCASCGTENEPDSRFCGGCGARVAKSQVAPTHKISDDAPYPIPASQPAPVIQPQYSTLPPQMPPAPVAAAAPPVRMSGPLPEGTVQRPRTSAPIASSTTGESLVERPAGGRRWGLVALILVVDLGLAAAGAWMLSQSLDTKESSTK
ncbi:MAG TPA: zinc ribbon domain-containing protein [Kofleriaceae bacterium]|jgi:hypothetical protein|nr:zinc ribbon domain-containing protein [Kofleriaceae bacterium]